LTYKFFFVQKGQINCNLIGFNLISVFFGELIIMTVASMIKTTGKAFRYTGQSMLHIQNLGFFHHPERPNPFRHLWDEDSLMKVIKSDLWITGVACGLIALLTGTIPFFTMTLLLAAPTIALVGLGLSYLGQKLEENNEVNIQPALA
jgi:uncharacterized membrane protein